MRALLPSIGFLLAALLVWVPDLALVQAESATDEEEDHGEEAGDEGDGEDEGEDDDDTLSFEGVLAEADTDKDGLLSKAELIASMHYDEEEEEAKEHLAWIENAFKATDKNADGKMDSEEFRAFIALEEQEAEDESTDEGGDEA